MIRRLAAILAADVVGYSALVAADEVGTLEALRRMRLEVFRPAVAGHRGRIVKAMGDGWLVEFDSAVDAVNAAVSIQVALERDLTIRLRIGIHIGDITHDDEDIYGDGVNVAARLEALAEPGAVMISDPVHGSLDGTLTPSFDDGGERRLKNIPRPVRVWTRPPGGAETSEPQVTPDGSIRERSCKTRIAIEPIPTSDPREEVRELANALTGDLSRYLAEGRWYRGVISERPTPGSYCIRASLRARGERLRLEVAILAPDGTELRSDKIDGSLDDVFGWQDETAATVALTAGEVIGDLERRRLDAMNEAAMSPGALVHRTLLYQAAARDETRRNLQLLRAAMGKDPDWAFPRLCAAWFASGARRLGFADQLGTEPGEIEAWIGQAEALGGLDADCRALLAYVKYEMALDVDLDRFKATMNPVLRHAPFHQMALFLSGCVYFWQGEAELSVSHLRKMIAIDGNALAHAVLAMALITAGRGEEAVGSARKALEITPDGPYGLRALAAAYASLGRLEEAQEAARRILDNYPSASIDTLKQSTHVVDNVATRRYFDALELAGLP